MLKVSLRPLTIALLMLSAHVVRAEDSCVVNFSTVLETKNPNGLKSRLVQGTRFRGGRGYDFEIVDDDGLFILSTFVSKWQQNGYLNQNSSKTTNLPVEDLSSLMKVMDDTTLPFFNRFLANPQHRGTEAGEAALEVRNAIVNIRAKLAQWTRGVPRGEIETNILNFLNEFPARYKAFYYNLSVNNQPLLLCDGNARSNQVIGHQVCTYNPYVQSLTRNECVDGISVGELGRTPSCEYANGVVQCCRPYIGSLAPCEAPGARRAAPPARSGGVVGQ